MTSFVDGLHVRTTPGAKVEQDPPGWARLTIPPGPAGSYRWAQLDDYLHRPRREFIWTAPFELRLRARVSATNLPGTWGFGLWNDPFNASIGIGGTARRLPALPNTAWFFYASPPNHLAFRDTHPAQGLLAATFRSPLWPAWLMAPGALALPLAVWPPTARLLRRAAGRLIQEDAALVDGDPTLWHSYGLCWESDRVRFAVDGMEVFETPISPQGRLGLVIWIDNQYAAFPSDGRLRFGTLACAEEAWLECQFDDHIQD